MLECFGAGSSGTCKLVERVLFIRHKSIPLHSVLGVSGQQGRFRYGVTVLEFASANKQFCQPHNSC